MSPPNRDFAADVKRHVDDFLIPKYERNMPLRLVDTYTGLILWRWEIVSLLKKRKDFREKLNVVVEEAKHVAKTIDPDHPSTERPNLNHLETFIAQYLAYAMFSHRWRGREPTLEDVGKVHGIYSLCEGDLANEDAFYYPKGEKSPSLVQKLQEFCCLAAKLGYRWAWSDTCCINKRDALETSESINSMFQWYRHSGITIVYLDDVDDVAQGRLDPVYDEHSNGWFRDREILNPLPPPSLPPRPPFHPPPSPNIYAEPLQTKEHFPLHKRLNTHPKLQTAKPDTQVDDQCLETHLIEKTFLTKEECEALGDHTAPPAWTTRGWTLQEMLAPKCLRFYSRQWTLLEAADDRDTNEEEKKLILTAFKYRARLVDHRDNNSWIRALKKTTGVPMEDIRRFRVGTKDVRSRLLWAAKRTTTKVEDMAYCLLGIFDITLPAMYGEGHRAFFRLQEELIKRTGDVTVFDWCGRSSSINSFLAYKPECFIQPNISNPHIQDSMESVFWMIINIFRAIVGTAWTAIKAAITKAIDWIKSILHSPPPGHSLVNGELNVSVFEHQVRYCEELGDDRPSDDLYHHYKLAADGLEPTNVVLSSRAVELMKDPKQYYLCRAWSRNTENVFHILLDLLEYTSQEKWNHFWGKNDEELDNSAPVDMDEDCPESKLQEEMQTKQREVKMFFNHSFPVYLVHAIDGRRVRVNTVNRVEGKYLGFDFTMPVVMRSIL